MSGTAHEDRTNRLAALKKRLKQVESYYSDQIERIEDRERDSFLGGSDYWTMRAQYKSRRHELYRESGQARRSLQEQIRVLEAELEQEPKST